jgi:hypothetical protein
MGLRGKEDAELVITDQHTIDACRHAILNGEEIVLRGHHGYVMRIHPDVSFVRVLLRHTGPQLCECKEIPR